MSVLRVKNGDQWDIVPAIKGDTGDPAADESITDAMLVPDGIKTEIDWLWGNQLTGELSGDLLTASDAYAAPPMALVVDGRSTQDGTPTPDAPVEIVSLEQTNLTFAGANRMYLDASASGITVSDGVYEGTVRDLNAAIRCVYPIPAGSALTVKFRSLQSTAGNMNVVGIRAADGGTNYLLSPPYTQTKWQTYTYITSAVYSEIHFWSNASSNIRCQIKDLCIRVDGSTVYEPYQATNVLLNLTQALRSLPNGTKDELHLSYLRPSKREGWAWYNRELVQRVGIGVITNGGYQGGEFDTTNGFTLYAPWAVFGITDADVDASKNNIRCDKLQAVTSDDATKTDVIWARSTNLVINLAGYTTQSDANAALIALAPAVHYVLATPITTQLDPIELPIMPSKDTTIWSDPSAQLKVTYIQDTNLVIENLEATVADMATS